MEARKIIRALFFLGIMVGAGTVFLGRAIAENEGARISFAYSNPLAPADFSSYLIIVSVCYWLTGKTARRAVVAIALSILGLAAVFRTGTRGPVFVIPPVLLVVFYFYRRTVNLKLVIQIMLVLAVLYGAITVIRQQGLIGERFQSKDVEAGFMIRLKMMKMTLMGWLENPILGTGPGDTSIQIEAEGEGYPHNLVLEVLSELGLVGFIPFLFLITKPLSGWRYLTSEHFENTDLKSVYVPIWACYFMAFISTFKMGGYAGSNMFYFFVGASLSLEMLCRQSLEQAFWKQQSEFIRRDEIVENHQYVFES
jgi:O-antigen ligase